MLGIFQEHSKEKLKNPSVWDRAARDSGTSEPGARVQGAPRRLC